MAATTEGVVTSAQQGFQSRDDAEPPRIEYRFTVDGVEHTGSSEIYIPFGNRLQVRYLPSDPSTNLAAEDHDRSSFTCGFYAVLLGAIGVYLFMFSYSEATRMQVTEQRYSRVESTPFERFPIVILSALSAYMLYKAAMGVQPYGFYQVLRWLTCGTAAMLAVYAHRWGNPWAPWLFAVVAILFNPIAPIHFSRRTWSLIDLPAAVVMLAAAYALKPREARHNHVDLGA